MMVKAVSSRLQNYRYDNDILYEARKVSSDVYVCHVYVCHGYRIYLCLHDFSIIFGTVPTMWYFLLSILVYYVEMITDVSWETEVSVLCLYWFKCFIVF